MRTRIESVEENALVRRPIFLAWLGAVIVNLVFLLTFFAACLAWQPVFFETVPLGRALRILAVLVAVAYPMTAVGAYLYARHIGRRATSWLREGRPPAGDELGLVAALPRRFTSYTAAVWTLALVVGIPLLILFLGVVPFPFLTSIKTLAGWASLSIFACSVTYLVCERALRPLRAMAMAAGPPVEGPHAMRLLPKLVFAWLGIAGIPFGIVSLLFVGLDDNHLARAPWVLWEASAVTVLAGILVTIYTARAITDPIHKVRAGMRTVGGGDLDATVQVEEVGELGDLQVGFNRMVEGLRERERMREVFGHHVGAEVARRALEGVGGLGGERCQATAMFVDVIGSTSLAQQRSADDVVEILNRFFDAIVRCVGANGGFVNKFAGDGAMCVFGVPDEQPDHAARALCSARALRAEIAVLEIEAAIGVSSGDVVAGNVGAADRYEYTVIGDPVNEASRLTEQAKTFPSKVLAGSATVDAAGPEGAGWREVGSFELRGRSAPTVAYEPV